MGKKGMNNRYLNCAHNCQAYLSNEFFQNFRLAIVTKKINLLFKLIMKKYRLISKNFCSKIHKM